MKTQVHEVDLGKFLYLLTKNGIGSQLIVGAADLTSLYSSAIAKPARIQVHMAARRVLISSQNTRLLIRAGTPVKPP
jgi:hypothetical protein